jgi:hypothetical protein
VRKVRPLPCLFLALFLGGYITSHLALYSEEALDQRWIERQYGSRRAWDVPTLLLQVLAGEFKGLLADLIVMEAGAQLGTEVISTGAGHEVVVRPRDWETIARLFNHAMALDPRFEHTYMLAQGWLPWDGGMVEETQKILRLAAENRPWDWRPRHLLGFNEYYFLQNPGEAGKIFLEASKIPDAPPFLAILGARLAHKGGQTEAAIGLLRVMLAGKTAEDPGHQDMVNRLRALEGVFVLEQAVKYYQAVHGELPPGLDTLTREGILTSLPANPYDLPYCLDAEGAVHFDDLNCTVE